MDINFEHRLSRKHIKFSGKHNWGWAPLVASMLGFGLSYIPHTALWSSKQRKMIWEDLNQAQKRLDRIIRFARFATSLEVRSVEAFNYSNLSRFLRLQSLSICGEISTNLDIRNLKNLRVLACDTESGKRIVGLKDLINLRYIHVHKPSITWLNTLPGGIMGLFTSGRFSGKADFSRFLELRQLSIGQTRSFNFQEFQNGAPNLQELTIANVRELSGLEVIPNLFPSLEKIVVTGLSDEAMHQLDVLNESKYVIDLYV